MQLLLPLLLLEVAGQPAIPASPGMISCDKPAADDDRPHTLCLAETWLEQAEVGLERQLKITIARVEADSGARAAERLRNGQRDWVKLRDSECEAVAGTSPSPQVGRNYVSCQAERTEERTAQLAALAGPAPELVAAEITDPSRMEERMADFRRSMLDSGNRGRLTACRMIMDVTQGLINSNHSYGAICMIKPADTMREVFVCNDEIVGHFAIAPAAAASRDAVVAFVKSKCVGG